MKHISIDQLNHCIIKEYDPEFRKDVFEAFHYKVKADCDGRGIYFVENIDSLDEEELSMEEAISVLSEYYEINIISIYIDSIDSHVIIIYN